MDFADCINRIRSQMRDPGVDLLLGIIEGGHFMKKRIAVMVLSDFKSIGNAMVILPWKGKGTLVVSPPWDVERAAEHAAPMQAVGADDVVNTLADYLARSPVLPARVGTAGLASMPWPVEERATRLLRGEARAMERAVFGGARRKTAEQIAKARRAVEIAERGYELLLGVARPGVREDELAVKLKSYMKTLGAEDNFLMLCAGSHNRAVQPSSGRRLEPATSYWLKLRRATEDRWRRFAARL